MELRATVINPGRVTPTITVFQSCALLTFTYRPDRGLEGMNKEIFSFLHIGGRGACLFLGIQTLEKPLRSPPEGASAGLETMLQPS